MVTDFSPLVCTVPSTLSSIPSTAVVSADRSRILSAVFLGTEYAPMLKVSRLVVWAKASFPVAPGRMQQLGYWTWKCAQL